MNGLGEGVAFAGLCIASTWLEVNGKPTGFLWFIVGMWAIFSDWGQKKEGAK